MKIADKIELIPIDKIRPYPRNTKKHSIKQVEKIANSIEEYGFTVPVIVDGEYNLIAGHGRYEASKKINLEKIPGIKRDDLSDEQIRAYRIADNKIAECEWDDELLKMEIEELKEGNYDLGLLGFDENEIKEILEEKEPIIANIEDLLKEINVSSAIESPDWVVIRSPLEARVKIDQVLKELKDEKIKVEKSYE